MNHGERRKSRHGAVAVLRVLKFHLRNTAAALFSEQRSAVVNISAAKLIFSLEGIRHISALVLPTYPLSVRHKLRNAAANCIFVYTHTETKRAALSPDKTNCNHKNVCGVCFATQHIKKRTFFRSGRFSVYLPVRYNGQINGHHLRTFAYL